MEGKIFFIINPFLIISVVVLFIWLFGKNYSEKRTSILNVLILGVSGYLFLGTKPDGPSEYFRLFYGALFICGSIGSFLLLFFKNETKEEIRKEIKEEVREEIEEKVREEIQAKEDLDNTTTEE